ncbi:hypothetical protein SAMN02745121_06200 [Nannocystis exedens]|uniref:Uncharacterized protein n=1 Tax=Nannocystis exedens TaxID=54 RepID=A0A1I2EQT4_9BACT|nr:hypothetical protein NAEX_06969 [Nannocystis exedens]SFE94866.1 hypothetical protein SAMN02745121_06200 [Nannocystis exedens]
MQPVHVPSARRHLLDRPQRLGLLPTVWFWNDHERQRLVLPIVLSVTLPWMPVLFYLALRLPLPFFALLTVVNILTPYLGLGVIERHIRRELRRRARLGDATDAPHVRASPAERLPSSARRIYLALAASGGLGSAFAVGQVWGAFTAALCVLALTAFLAAVWRVSLRAPALPPPTPHE